MINRSTLTAVAVLALTGMASPAFAQAPRSGSATPTSAPAVSGTKRAVPPTAHKINSSNIRLYDGPWSVVILTTKGKCDPSYRISGQIVNGGIFYSYGSLEVTGRVEDSGHTTVHVTYGTDHGEAHGRLLETYGTGTWSGNGPDGLCSGTWVATRAGSEMESARR